MRSLLGPKSDRFQKRLSFERLEDRALMAGNVTAACVNGHLTICGDSKDNIVVVRQVGECTWEIKGLLGTTINKSGTCVVKKVTGCLNVDLKGGNDAVAILNGSLRGCLNVCDTQGNNAVALANLCVAGLNVKTGNGFDAVVASCVTVKCDRAPVTESTTADLVDTNGVRCNSCCIDTGGGLDLILLNKVCGSCCTIDVRGCEGTDIIGLIGCDAKSICVDSGKGACDIVAVVCCKADCCDVRCGDSSDIYASGGNCFDRETCGAKIKLDVTPFLSYICNLPKLVCQFAIPWFGASDLKLV